MTRQSKASRQTPQTLPCQDPFPYADYVQALDAVEQLFAGPCTYVAILGASGMGKTSLARELLGKLDGTRNTLLYLSSSRISAMGVVRCVAHRLHLWPKRNYLETVQLVSAALSRAPGQVMLWIDEADQADADTLQEVRMIAESELKDTPLLSVVLSGLPALAANLDSSALFPLKRRIARNYLLAGLKRDELTPFLRHRFGPDAEQRIPNAFRDELFERAQAAPAVIDKIITQALAQKSAGPIDKEVCHAILDTNGL
jgi:type II secretory pathway predicted ATPase ExeA